MWGIVFESCFRKRSVRVRERERRELRIYFLSVRISKGSGHASYA